MWRRGGRSVPKRGRNNGPMSVETKTQYVSKRKKGGRWPRFKVPLEQAVGGGALIQPQLSLSSSGVQMTGRSLVLSRYFEARQKTNATRQE